MAGLLTDNVEQGTPGRKEVVDKLRAASSSLMTDRFADGWWAAFYDALASPLWQVRRLGCSLGMRIPLEMRPYEKIVEDLAHTDNAGYRNALVELLTGWGVSSVRPLREAYPACDARTRKFLVDVLKEIGSRDSVNFLIRCLDEEDINLRIAVIEALAEVPSEQALEALWHTLLLVDRFEIQAAVLEVLIHQADAVRGRFDLAQTTRLLQNSFLHKLLIRLYAVVADRESVNLLLDALEVLSERRLRDAVRALDQILHRYRLVWKLLEDRGAPQISLTLPDTVLAAAGDIEVSRKLLDSVSDFSAEVLDELVRRTGVDALWDIAEHRACTRAQFEAFADILSEADRDRMVSVCRKHLRYSGELGDVASMMLEQLDPLAAWEVLLDRLINGQKIKYHHLERPRSAQVVDRLVERLDHWSDQLSLEEDWIHFLDLTARLEASELSEKVELALHHASPLVRGAAGSCLAMIDEERFARHLPSLLADNIRVVRRVLRTVRRQKLKGALPWTEALWQGGDPWIRMEVLRAWRDLGAPIGTAVEIALRDDFPPLVREALAALVVLQQKGYEDQAAGLLHNKDPSVVVEALHYLTDSHYPLTTETVGSLLDAKSAVIREAGLHYIERSGVNPSELVLEKRLASESDPQVFALMGNLLARQS